MEKEFSNKENLNLEGWRVEYINEEELGPNYSENYQVEQDRNTGEFYILDFDNRIKFIIVKDKLGSNLGNYEEQFVGGGVEGDLAPHRANAEIIGTDQVDGTVKREVSYVQESDLSQVDLANAEIYESDETGEQILFERNHPGIQWVVLNNDWRESQFTNYFAVEDLDLESLQVLADQTTGREFIVDEESRDKYYLVNASNIGEEFKKKWLYLSQLGKGGNDRNGNDRSGNGNDGRTTRNEIINNSDNNARNNEAEEETLR